MNGIHDLGDTYHHRWLAALEKLAVGKGLCLGEELARRKRGWVRAAADTEPGRPIELPKPS